jgi:hypothetical protein
MLNHAFPPTYSEHMMSNQTESAAPAADFETRIRDIPDAAKTWLRSRPEYRLAELLVAHVSEADANLPREQFLRLVLDRIVDEMSAPLPRSP